MPATSIQEDIVAFKAWDRQTRPILKRMGEAVRRLPSRPHKRLAQELSVIRSELLEAQEALDKGLDDRLLLVLRFERHIQELQKQIDKLTADCEEWRREYEPDSDPTRPAVFSNLRHALAALFHPAR